MHPFSSNLPITKKQSSAFVLKWFEGMGGNSRWDLSQVDACEMLGGVSKSTYRSWVHKAELIGEIKISLDVETRLRLLLGIHKALFESAPNGFEYDFFKRPINHPLFNYQSAKELILDDPSVLTLWAVKKHFNKRSLLGQYLI